MKEVSLRFAVALVLDTLIMQYRYCSSAQHPSITLPSTVVQYLPVFPLTTNIWPGPTEYIFQNMQEKAKDGRRSSGGFIELEMTLMALVSAETRI